MRHVFDLVCQGLLTQLPTVLVVATATSLRSWLRRWERLGRTEGGEAGERRPLPPE